jgi:hypothetical protein
MARTVGGRKGSWGVWAAIVAIVIVALWMATPFFVRQLYPEDVATRGQFGDIFGSVNALFSGLALAGVIIAILLQREETRALQRAYISVESAGIRDATTGQLMGHVKITNVGHLPASQLKCQLEITPSNDPNWAPPASRGVDDLGGLHIGVSIKRGSPGISIPAEQFIYIWGCVTYFDGFGEARFTNFCHRYNTARKETPSGVGYRIRRKYARQHEHGNELS